MLDAIKKALEEAKKHHILHHYCIACGVEDYPEIKAICKSNFPTIRLIPSAAIERGKVYLWDDEQIRKNLHANNETNIEGGNSI